MNEPTPDATLQVLEAPRPRLMRFASLLADFEADARDAHDAHATGQPRGPITGLKAIDAALGSAFAPGIHILHGSPGAGKTAFALQVAASCGTPALFVSCEMSPLELLRRHTARCSGKYLGRLKSGEYTPEIARGFARQAIEAAPDLSLADATREPLAIADLRDAAQAARGDSKYLLVVVDSLHAWIEGAVTSEPKYAALGEYEALNLGLLWLRQLAHEFSCAVLTVAERNRASMGTGGLSAGAGSRKIEYSAETILDLERDPKNKPTGDSQEVPVQLKFAKNRNGAPGVEVDLWFSGPLQRFRQA